MAIAAVLSTSAQTPHTPEKGSAERKAILDALRGPVEKELRQKIVFSTDHFKVRGNWAFLSGSPRNASGGEPDYRNTNYWEQFDSGAFDNNFFALMRRSGGKWKIVIHAIGCTDVCYLDWWSKYKAPKAIFPFVE